MSFSYLSNDVIASEMRNKEEKYRESLLTTYKNIKKQAETNSYLKAIATEMHDNLKNIYLKKEKERDALLTILYHLEDIKEKSALTDYLQRENYLDIKNIMLLINKLNLELEDYSICNK